MDVLSRGLPQNLDAERTVLAAIMADEGGYCQVASLLKPDDFAIEKHRRLLTAMGDIYERGHQINAVTLAEELQRTNRLQDCGGLSYLVEVQNAMPQLLNLESVIDVVRDKAASRRIIIGCQKIIDTALLGERSEKLLGSADALVRGVADSQSAHRPIKPASQILMEVGGVDGLLKPCENGIPWPWEWLNDLTAGLHGGQMIVVAGRPGKGKSAFASQVAAHVCKLNVGAVPVFSLEMKDTSIMRRMACAAAGVSSARLRRNHLSRDEMMRVGRHAVEIASSPLWIGDSMNVNVPAIHSALRIVKSQSRLALVCVDYLQLMSGLGKTENRNQEVSAISRGLKMAAVEFNVPFLVLSQFNREADGVRPQLKNLRESGSIEQDADAVILLHDKKQPQESAGWLTDVILEKQREGPVGEKTMYFNAMTTMFEEAA